MDEQLWISRNPAYEGIIRSWASGQIPLPSMTLVNCTNCAGIGRIIVRDGSGQYDVPCQACGGSGQRDNGDGQ